MTNITLDVETAIFDEVQVYAAKRNTTVNRLVHDFFQGIAEQANETVRAQRRLAELVSKSTLDVGDVTWSRDELHER